MAEAQNLNMVGGHFIWIWADTSSTTEFFEAYGVPLPVDDPTDKQLHAPINTVLSQEKITVDTPKTSKQDQGSARYHLDDLLDRKMDFEDLNPNREANKQRDRARQRNRNKSKDAPNRNGARGRSQPPDRYIIGLNSESSPDISDEFGMLNKRNQEAVKIEKRSSEESAEHFFISNLNTDDNLNYIIDNTNANADVVAAETGAESDAKPKRRISMKDFSAPRPANYTANHVLFHHFKDFPVGFLALRPIRMTVDRHFIRAAVRLLASTWAKVELEAREDVVRAIQRAKSKLNRWDEHRRGSRTQRRKRGSGNANTQVNSKSNLPTASDLTPNAHQPNTRSIKSRFDSHQPPPPTNKPNMSSGFFDDEQSHQTFKNRTEQQSNNQSDKLGSGEADSVLKAPKLSRRDASEGGRMAAPNKRHNAWWSQENEWLTRDSDIRYQNGAPHYRGGCYGQPDDEDVLNAKYFAR